MDNRSFLFWGFRSPRELLRARLGTLERQVIEVVWAGAEVTVRDVHARLDGKVAYTTVMTTLDRLFRKGLLARTKRSRAFVYSALATREELDDIVASGSGSVIGVRLGAAEATVDIEISRVRASSTSSPPQSAAAAGDECPLGGLAWLLDSGVGREVEDPFSRR